jgi:hypothetical protein
VDEEDRPEAEEHLEEARRVGAGAEDAVDLPEEERVERGAEDVQLPSGPPLGPCDRPLLIPLVVDEGHAELGARLDAAEIIDARRDADKKE